MITEADSIAELEKMVNEAALGWMECELDDGKAIPSPSNVEQYAGKDPLDDGRY